METVFSYRIRVSYNSCCGTDWVRPFKKLLVISERRFSSNNENVLLQVEPVLRRDYGRLGLFFRSSLPLLSYHWRVDG